MSHRLACYVWHAYVAGTDAARLDGLAQFLLRLGEGTKTVEGCPEGLIRIPDHMQAPTGTLEGLISHVYPNLADGVRKTSSPMPSWPLAGWMWSKSTICASRVCQAR